VLALLGWAVALTSAASAAPSLPIHSYSYDSLGNATQLAYDASERGPPSQLARATTSDAVGPWSRGPASRPEGTTPAVAFASLRPIGRPEAAKGVVRVDGDTPLERGVTVPLAAVGEWTTAFDESTGWLCIAEDLGRPGDDLVLLATGVVVGLSEGRLTSLWLAPSIE